MNKQRTKDWLLLSTCIDGELTAREQKRLERMVRARPELQEEIDQLKQTCALIRSLPRRQAPRNFTLTPDMATARRPARLLPVLSVMSAVTALVALALILVQFTPGLLNRAPASLMAKDVQMEMAMAVEESVEVQTTPDIIYWEGAPPAVPVEGKGGGSAEDSFAMPMTLMEPQPGAMNIPPQPAAGEEGAVAEQLTTESDIAEEPVPVEEIAPAPMQEEQTPAETASEARLEDTAQFDENQSPILGIRPTEQAGLMLVPESRLVVEEQPRLLWPFGIALLVIAAGSGVAAVCLRRRSR